MEPPITVRLGDIEITPVWDGDLDANIDGVRGLDPQEARRLLDAEQQLTGADPLVLPVRAFLVKAARQIMLVDAGSGTSKMTGACVESGGVSSRSASSACSQQVSSSAGPGIVFDVVTFNRVRSPAAFLETLPSVARKIRPSPSNRTRAGASVSSAGSSGPVAAR